MSESARDVRMICPPPSPYDPSMLSIREAPRGAPQSFTTEAARVKRRAVCGASAGCVVIEKEEIGSQHGRVRRLSRTVVVGDIHGCYDELRALVESVGLRESDRLVSVGDLVTKGEKSREVLELFMNDARCSSVIGNHDRALLEYWKGLRPGSRLEWQSLDDLTALRTLGLDRESREGTPWYEVYDGERVALFGHWPSAAPRRGPRAVGLDTGCVYGYKLTAYVVETGELHSVPAFRAYDTPK